MELTKITTEDVHLVSFRIAKMAMEWDEPIPDFATRYPGVLESCLANPFQTFNSEDLYPTLIDKASNMFYLLVKNHPFENGNKRIAICTLLVFLKFNGFWISVPSPKLYQFARFVANSEPELSKEIEAGIKEFISSNLDKY